MLAQPEKVTRAEQVLLNDTRGSANSNNARISTMKSSESTGPVGIASDEKNMSLGTQADFTCCVDSTLSEKNDNVEVDSTISVGSCCLTSGMPTASKLLKQTSSQSNFSSSPLFDRVIAYRKDRGASTMSRFSVNTQDIKIETIRLIISGMTCSGCCTRIEEFLRQQPGIQSADVSLLTSRGVFAFDPRIHSSKSIEQFISTLGFASSLIPSESLVSIVLHIGRESPSRAKKLLRMTEGVISIHEERDRIYTSKSKSPAESFVPNKLLVEYDPEVIGARTLVRRLTNSLGFQVIASPPRSHTLELEEEEVAKFKRYLMWSVLLALPVFFVEFVVPGLSHDMEALFQQNIVRGLSYREFIGIFCSTPMLLVVAFPIHESAFLSLRYGFRVTMDVLITISSFTAYIFSMSTVLGQILHFISSRKESSSQPSPPLSNKTLLPNETFFEVTTMLITLIFVGRYMEKIVKAKAAHSMDALLQIQAKTAILIEDNDIMTPSANTVGKNQVNCPRETYIDVLLVERGDVLKILPGARVPTDGVVIEGFSTVDESMVTGESRKVSKIAGSTVVGGTINAQGVLMMRVTHTVNESMLAKMVHMVDDAQSSKCPSQSIADVVSSCFTTFIIFVAGFMFAWWFWLAKSHQIETNGWAPLPFALRFAITVLVISCPCAISLAVPTAIMVATTVGSQVGLLFKGGQALEALDKIDVVMFDKTGTLTSGKLNVVDFIVARNVSTNDGRQPFQSSTMAQHQQPQFSARKLWGYLSAAEKNSEHAIARAVLIYAHRLHTPIMHATEFEAVPGCGVVCRVESHDVRVGSLKWMLDVLGVDIPLDLLARNEHYQKQGCIVVCLAIDNVLCALVALQDTPRLEAQFVIKQLRRCNIQTWIVTGDQRETALAVAKDIGIHEVTVIADALPHQKVDKMRLLQGLGKRVAFIGDGVNDGPALAMADIGIAVGAGTDIAIKSADLVLVKDDLRDLLNALDLSRKTNRLIRWNFLWSFLYNLLMMPLACGALYPIYNIYIPPALAGLSELLSSVPVILFSLMLNFWKPPYKQQPLLFPQGYGSDEFISTCIDSPNSSYASIDIPNDVSESTPLLIKK